MSKILLNEYFEKLDERYEGLEQELSEMFQEISIPAPAEGAVALAVVGAVASLAYKAYRDYLTHAGVACAGRKGVEKQKCMAAAKEAAIRTQISFLEKGKSKCSKSKDPGKCKDAMDKRISKLRRKLG